MVRAGEHQIHLCWQGRTELVYRVALGRGGVGKTRAGDGRTPVGSYALGAPRASAKFHLFIPVGYPTGEQRARGYGGGDIGIHGPKRGWRWLGRVASLYDWTSGCIAVEHDEDIEAIAGWVRRRHAGVVVIEAAGAE